MVSTQWINNSALGAAVFALGLTAPLNAQDKTEPAAAPETSQPSASEPAASKPTASGPQNAKPPSVLVILAHPDDEVLLAPALARIARAGGEVSAVFATSGDAGPGFSGLDKGAELAALREGEARCSSFALGLEAPEFWQLGDGALSEDADQPGSNARSLITRINETIDRMEPSIVMTFGPDGASGHADHRMVSAAATQVIQAMDTDRPDLLYIAMPGKGPSELPGLEGWAWVNPALITDRISFEPVDLDAAQAAVQCYESQFNPEMRDSLIYALNQQVWRGRVHLRLAFPSPF